MGIKGKPAGAGGSGIAGGAAGGNNGGSRVATIGLPERASTSCKTLGGLPALAAGGSVDISSGWAAGGGPVGALQPYAASSGEP
mmetsp:Transcript_19962/g.54409  ORF Transcript_19962/g.54409 Transcript_19962/m.54409 type:complete len:84 (-) Transcript_19962:820-1071(-)